MAMSDRISPHDEAEELLPWYAAGQLDAGDRLLVERHLSSCSECRSQLAVERRLIQEFRSRDPQVEAGWARLRARIEPRHVEHRRPAHRAWGFARLPGVAVLAAAQFAFLIFGAGLLLWLSRPNYHALGSPPTSPTADVIVMFRAEATVDDVKATLRAANASIVDGPTPADAYLLHVPERQRDRSLARLRADNDVQMAEPIDGAPQ
jgi:predicted anti-sigma-YlaC factor YlaD